MSTGIAFFAIVLISLYVADGCFWGSSNSNSNQNNGGANVIVINNNSNGNTNKGRCNFNCQGTADNLQCIRDPATNTCRFSRNGCVTRVINCKQGTNYGQVDISRCRFQNGTCAAVQ